MIVWVGLWVKLPLRQVGLASWLEQVYRLHSHWTDLCTWLQTRLCCVKPLCPFSSVCLPFITPTPMNRLFFFIILSILSARGMPSPPSSPLLSPFFVSLGLHRFHSHKYKHAWTAMHDQTNSVRCRRLMGEQLSRGGKKRKKNAHKDARLNERLDVSAA